MAAEKTDREWYNAGWYYSEVGVRGLEWGDEKGYPDAWYCGYLDYASGVREKGHLLVCKGCPEHPGGGGYGWEKF